MPVENSLVWQTADDEEKGGVRVSRRDRFDEKEKIGDNDDEYDDGSPSSSNTHPRNKSARHRSRSSRRSIDPSAALPIQYRILYVLLVLFSSFCCVPPLLTTPFSAPRTLTMPNASARANRPRPRMPWCRVSRALYSKKKN